MIYDSEIYAQNMNQIVNDKPPVKSKIIVRKSTKKLVLKKKTTRKRSFRLLTFNQYDEEVYNGEDDGTTGGSWTPPEKEFMIQMFGINEKGETATIFVKGFTPFFYIKVDDDWKQKTCLEFISQMRTDIGKLYEASILTYKLVSRKKLYGFDGGMNHKFIMITFSSEAAMRKAKNLWYTSYTKNGEYHRELSETGYEFGSTFTRLYEAQIPPLLRMFHIRNISPSGWIELDNKSLVVHKKTSTSCAFECTIDFKDIIPQPEKEVVVPYKICSFDIEASSSHGDFPLPVKNYKKLAANIVDLWYNVMEDGIDNEEQYLKHILSTAFKDSVICTASRNGFMDSFEHVDDVDIVYTKTKMLANEFDILITRWLKRTVNDTDNMDGDEMDDTSNDICEDETELDACDEGHADNQAEEVGPSWMYKKRHGSHHKKTRVKGLTVLQMINNNSISRDTKLQELTRTLDDVFPKLHGDKVTFIGSTFLKYGNDKPYLNHCIVLDTCSKMPNAENAQVESYTTEKKALLAWTELIQREDPDIIIGYNIFGFDYNFMHIRSKQLGCEREFLKLSRNKGEVCLKRDWKTGKEGLETNTLYIASGQHDLKFVKMTGRLQVDMYNYFRRDYQLMKYKLDYVAGYFIGDGVLKIEHVGGNTKIYSKNLTGLENGSYINFEEAAHSVDAYKDGEKFQVFDVNEGEGSFWIDGEEMPNMSKKVRWGLAKDDVTPQDIFRMTNEGPDARAIIAKYCVQDCNLVHHLMRKIDVMTGFIEMSTLCSVPMDFLVMRGQGIKLTSYIAKKCREKNTLMPVIDKGNSDEGYEGAIVLPPKCDLYLNDPVACVDYSSLYPSSMISENISHDSKVWTKEYDLLDVLLKETGELSEGGDSYKYDNLPGYKYVDIKYDAYKWQRKGGNPKAAMEKVCVGYKVCRFAQFPEGKGVMPAILEELLAARKATRKLIPLQTDEFMKNVLDQRQLSIKVTANSMYGQTGAKTSSFYEKDCAASTTAIGRKLLTYAKRVIEEAYHNIEVVTKCHGKIRVNAEYVYGDTDSVFFKFNPAELDGTPIIKQKALEITIELAQEAGVLASKFLKKPHDLEYEKTFLPFCLLSKKRYVGMLYEMDPQKCKRKSMGIVLKRRDNAPIVKDVYGGIIDILMKEQNVERAAAFLKECLQDIVDEKFDMKKLIITKSLRSGYKNPKQIAHKVLADRIGKRDPGSKPSVGDRVAYVYIENPDKKALQGARIETPEYIREHNIPINYAFYMTNQIMKPVQQVFALVLEKLGDFKKRKGHTLRRWKKELVDLKRSYPDPVTYKKKEDALRNKEVKAILFEKYLQQTCKAGNQSIMKFFM